MMRRSRQLRNSTLILRQAAVAALVLVFGATVHAQSPQSLAIGADSGEGGGFSGESTWGPEAATALQPNVPSAVAGPFGLSGFPPTAGRAAPCNDGTWTWQALPEGLIYRSYLAGVREPRFASVWNHERDWGWVWDVALGGRAGVFRYGDRDPLSPQGFQVDIEGAGFPRLDLEHDLDVLAADFRFGVPFTFGLGRYQTKLAFYHLSSHLGDEFMLRFPDWRRINYSRNALVWGHSYFLTEELRVYGEAAWSFDADGGAEPWEFQFGIDYSPAEPVSSLRGAPFIALGAHLRQEVDFGGNFVVQTGWQWRGPTGHLFRLGMQYFTGKSEQYEFYRLHEDKLGLGVWYDF